MEREGIRFFLSFFIQIIRWINKSRRGMKMIAFDETIKSEEFLRNILFYSYYSNRVAKGKDSSSTSIRFFEIVNALEDENCREIAH